MKKMKKKVKIGHNHGIHIRVASEIVKASQNFASEINIFKLNDPHTPINAKAFLDLTTAGLGYGEEVTLSCEGEDAEKAIELVEYIISSNFDKDG